MKNKDIIDVISLNKWIQFKKDYPSYGLRSLYASKNDNVHLYYYHKTGQFVIIENCEEKYSTYSAADAVETYNMI